MYERKFRALGSAILVSLGIAAAYVWPLAHYYGHAFSNVSSYQYNDWHGGLPFTWPFVAIAQNTFPISAPLSNLVATLGWIAFVLIVLVFALQSGYFFDYAVRFPEEAVFVALYAVAIFTYNAPAWARADFPRFALPILPWLLVFAQKYLPRKRWIVGALAVIMPVLAAASTVGIHNLTPFLVGR